MHQDGLEQAGVFLKLVAWKAHITTLQRVDMNRKEGGQFDL
jgi:hypothetical protein